MSSKNPMDESYDVTVLETISPFTFDTETVAKSERLARDASKGSYPVYTRPEEFILKVPLEVLGRPKFVLTLVKTFGGIAPIDTTGIRKILIR